MSETPDSGPGRREVAYRIFAAEFDDAEFSYSESDEERAPNYVVTPTGARVNRLFAVGVLTELEQVNEDVVRARIVDPTGPFVVYAGQYQPDALAFLESATPPLFVAITGKARTFEPEDGDRIFTSIRPESISEVDAETRDRWVVQTTEQTLGRVSRMASAKQSDLSGEALQTALTDAGVEESNAAGITLALDYYGTTGDYLQAVRDLALDSARVVAGDVDEAGTLSMSPTDGTAGPLSTLADIELVAPDSSSSETTADTAPTGEASTDDSSVEPTAAVGQTDAVDEQPSETATAEASETTDSTDTAEPTGTPDATETVEPTASSEPAETVESVEVTDQTDTSTTADAGTSGSLGDFESGGEAGQTDDSASAEDDDIDDFEAEFDLDDDERKEIEEEYGTDFQSGTEVEDAGEAGIETPDPEDIAPVDDTSGVVADSSSESGTAAPTGDDQTDEQTASTEDIDLEDAVMDAMTDLNDGSGADREAVLSAVIEEYGADREAVETAIQDALMGGRCYEPDDGKLTPI